MRTYKIEAIVLNLGLGEQPLSDIVKAEDIKDAINIFYKTYLTIEIISIRKTPEYNL